MDNGLFSLSGKTALVTGGSRGIGLAVAKGLAKHGADIAIIARNKSRLQAAKGQIQEYSGKKVWTFSFDLENTKEIEQFFKKIITVLLLQVVEILIWIADPDVAEVNDPGDALTVRIKQDVTPLQITMNQRRFIR